MSQCHTMQNKGSITCLLNTLKKPHFPTWTKKSTLRFQNRNIPETKVNWRRKVFTWSLLKSSVLKWPWKFLKKLGCILNLPGLYNYFVNHCRYLTGFGALTPFERRITQPRATCSDMLYRSNLKCILTKKINLFVTFCPNHWEVLVGLNLSCSRNRVTISHCNKLQPLNLKANVLSPKRTLLSTDVTQQQDKKRPFFC